MAGCRHHVAVGPIPKKAEEFSREQLSCLKVGREGVAVCGRHGMPSPGRGRGDRADSSPSAEYCIYCYRDGAFTEPDLTGEQAVMKYAPMMASNLGIPPLEAEEMVRQYLSTLPRWRE